MNTAVKSHFRASNNAAIKTREVRQKISSQWGSLNVHLQVISRQNVIFSTHYYNDELQRCVRAPTRAMRCAVASMHVRAKRPPKYVCEVCVRAFFPLVTPSHVQPHIFTILL